MAGHRSRKKKRAEEKIAKEWKMADRKDGIEAISCSILKRLVVGKN